MYKTMYAGASSLFFMVLSTIWIHPDWYWIGGFSLILILLVLRGKMGEITRKTENILFWLIIIFSIVVLIYIIRWIY